MTRAELEPHIGELVTYRRGRDGIAFRAKLGGVRIIRRRLEAHVKYLVGEKWIRAWVKADRIELGGAP